MSSERTTFADANYDDGSVDFSEYRAVSKGALLSLAFGILASLAFALFFYLRMGCSVTMLALLCIPGLIIGATALMRIKSRPRELTGKVPALVGIFLCAALFLGGIPLRIVMYVTEVPEGYERISFYELQPDSDSSRMPVSQRALELNGKKVFVEGYIFPGDRSENLKKFTLVRDLGTCCFGKQPPVTHMIDVELIGHDGIDWNLRLRKFGGVIRVDPAAAIMQRGAVFKLEADHVK